MSGLGFQEVQYVIRSLEDGVQKEHLVEGIQIGRFAVRHAIPGEGPQTVVGSSGLSVEEAPWRVDHIPSGFLIYAFRNSDDAYGFADDISRFSAKDPSSSDPKRAVKQIGPTINRWILFTRRQDEYVPFREWLAYQGEPWSPRGRRWRRIR